MSANGRLKPIEAPGRYFIDWTEDGKRIRKAAGVSAAAAQEAAAQEERELKARKAAKLAGVELVPQKQGRSLAVAITEYLAEIKLTKKPKTHAAYRLALGYFRESCHKATVEQIERGDLLRFHGYLRDKKKLSPRSQWNTFSNVMGFLKGQGMRLGVKATDWPAYTEEMPEVYGREELDRFFAACTPEEKLIFEFFLMTGMREQEVMYCTWDNVDVKQNVIRMTHNPQFGWTPKAYREREIPVPARLIEALLNWNKQAQPNCALIFPTSGCKPKFAFLDMCKAVAKRTGLNPDNFWLHKFRATFATWHLWAGVDLRTMQSWLGHRDLESTMRYLRPNHNSAMHAQVEHTFNASAPPTR